MSESQDKTSNLGNILIILGVIFDALGSFLLAFVILMQHDIQLFKMTTLPLQPAVLYAIAAFLIFFGIIISLLGIKRS